ncbi:MAG: hypothetical protein H0X13_05475 [Ramlibacter sp.]|nr:hypothetical protein [Ramlibacter sp.]
MVPRVAGAGPGARSCRRLSRPCISANLRRAGRPGAPLRQCLARAGLRTRIAHSDRDARHAKSGQAETAEDLRPHVKRLLAPCKYPRRIEFAGELPKTASGKIQRFRLRVSPGYAGLSAQPKML